MGKLSLAHTSINFLAMVMSTRLPKASEHFKDNRIITTTTTKLTRPSFRWRADSTTAREDSICAFSGKSFLNVQTEPRCFQNKLLLVGLVVFKSNVYAFVMENVKNAKILKKKLKQLVITKAYIKSHFGLSLSRLFSVHILRCTHIHTYKYTQVLSNSVS